jgi:iron complex transport system substrate-binding protein
MTPETPTTAVADVPNEGDGFPARIRHDDGVAEVPARPERIAALSGTHVEMLFAIGAGSQVIAGDLFSNYPPGEVESLQLLDSFNLSVEALIDLAPDLVVLSYDPGAVAAALEAVEIPTVLFETAGSLDDVYDQILALGNAAGHAAAAESLVAAMRSEIGGIVSDVGSATSGVTFYHESDPFSFYTPNSSSFIGRLYEMLGMVNIADAAPDEFDSGFPQLSAEYIVASNPEMIYLAGFGETPATVAAREGWETMSALDSGDVVVLDYDIASRWGPRVVELLQAIADGAIAARDG